MKTKFKITGETFKKLQIAMSQTFKKVINAFQFLYFHQFLKKLLKTTVFKKAKDFQLSYTPIHAKLLPRQF